MVRVLVAPQEFKGSLGADEAADAIANGLLEAHPDWEIDRLPMSDGGPGLLDAIRRAVKADTTAAVVSDPLGRRVLARYLRLRESGDAVIEAAQANGLWHVQPPERDPLYADTAGVGEIIADALAVHTKRIIIGVGGSATTDGGAGMAAALGARFLNSAGEPLPPGGAPLADLARIDWARPAFTNGVEFLVATDVTNPLLGPNGAARIYAPQKGATPEQVDILDAALHRYAAVVRRSLGVDIASLPGGGAAGGLAAGLVAFLGARIESGFELVAETVHLDDRIGRADLVVTGEGSFDSQSLQGKVTGRILERAAAAGKRAAVLAGRVSDPLPAVPAGTIVRALTDSDAVPGDTMERAAAHLKQLAASL